MIIDESLYQQIIKVMPIPCVDLIVEDNHKKFLLLKRKNEPAKGEWWFPGGRIFYGESMEEAAHRKLTEECGLAIKHIEQLFTIEVVFYDCEPPFHASSTLCYVMCEAGHIMLDSQSVESEWKTQEDWEKIYPASLGVSILKGAISFMSNRAIPKYLLGMLRYNL